MELNDVKSQLLNTQSVLSSTQIELDGLRNKGQQEELQIAEIKMMMHQVNYLDLFVISSKIRLSQYECLLTYLLRR